MGKGAHTPAFLVPSQRHPHLGTHRDTSKEADGAATIPGLQTQNMGPSVVASAPRDMEPVRVMELGSCCPIRGCLWLEGSPRRGQGGGRMPGSPVRMPGSSGHGTRRQGWSATSRESQERESRQAGSLYSKF